VAQTWKSPPVMDIDPAKPTPRRFTDKGDIKIKLFGLENQIPSITWFSRPEWFTTESSLPHRTINGS